MSETQASLSSSFVLPPGESLSLLELPSPLAGRHLWRRFEFSCRGDRVLLDVVAPDDGGPCPTLLVQPTPGSDRDLELSDGLDAWLSQGVAVASVTLPLFGERRSPKLTAKLEAAVRNADAGQEIDGTDRILWSEFTRQSVLELRTALDALEAAWQGAAPAVVFAGSGIAASVGAIFCVVDERPQAALLAGMGSAGPDGIAPASYLESSSAAVHQVEGEKQSLLEVARPVLLPALGRG